MFNYLNPFDESFSGNYVSAFKALTCVKLIIFFMQQTSYSQRVKRGSVMRDFASSARVFSIEFMCESDLGANSTVMAKSFENGTNISFHKVCCLSLYDGNLHILHNFMKSDQMNCN